MESSNTLARMLVQYTNLNKNDKVLELGVGTGIITRHILENIPNYNYLGVEKNEDYQKDLQPLNLNIHYIDASDINDLAQNENFQPTKIIASLPWTLMDQEIINTIIKNSADTMNKGTFSCYQYAFNSPALKKKIYQALDNSFESIQTSKIIYRNLPPAELILARK